MRNTDSCAGCNKTFGLNEPRAPFNGKSVHDSPGCLEKAERLDALQQQGIARLQGLVRNLGQQAAALLDRVGLPGVRVPAELRNRFKPDHQYRANEFADILSRGLTALFAASNNGKSGFRGEILAFAREAGRSLHSYVFVKTEEAAPVVKSVVRRAAKAAEPAARRVRKATRRVKAMVRASGNKRSSARRGR